MRALGAIAAVLCAAGCSTDLIFIGHRDAEVAADAASHPDGGPPDAQFDREGGEDSGAETGTPDAGKNCNDRTDCSSTEFCLKQKCMDDAGVCAKRPTVCNSDQDPVCDCDGVSYFNDCLRRRDGIAAATPGECVENAMPCGPFYDFAEITSCPMNAVCGLIKPSGEPSDVPCEIDQFFHVGQCWVMPEDCKTLAPADSNYMLCPAPTTGTPSGGTPGGSGQAGGSPGSFSGGTFGGGATFGGGGTFGGAGAMTGGTSLPTCVSVCEALKSGLLHVQISRQRCAP